MSTPNSTPSSISKGRSLAERTEERFFALDHVGVVRHFEGIELQRFVQPMRMILKSVDAEFEDATERLRGRDVYTAIANLQTDLLLTLWVTATQVEGVGVVLDAKIFHSTELSAEADERLSRLIGKLEDRILNLD